MKNLLKEITKKFLKNVSWILGNTCENVKWAIILQKFEDISWNILKKLKQLLKIFCVNFMQVKYGQILIKTYTSFE